MSGGRIRHPVTGGWGVYGTGQPTGGLFVSLPAPPWGDLDPGDRAETAPRPGAVRAGRSWDADPLLARAGRLR